MMNMVNRVAKVIYDNFNLWEEGGNLVEYEQLSDALKAQWQDTAVRVILELRDPNHDMTSAIVPVGEDRTDAVAAWQAMIDAALT